MEKGEYFNVRDMAWKILIETKAEVLPIKIAPICKAMDAKVISYSSGKERLGKAGLWHLIYKTDGFTYRNKSGYLIFYDDCKTEERQRFTICHELGHIALQHIAVGQVTLRNKEPHQNDGEYEKATNMFAARILAPASVLHFAGIKTAEEISERCNISLQAAAFRAERLAELSKRNKFLTSELEKTVLKQFNVFIEATRRDRFRAGPREP